MPDRHDLLLEEIRELRKETKETSQSVAGIHNSIAVLSTDIKHYSLRQEKHEQSINKLWKTVYGYAALICAAVIGWFKVKPD